MRVPCASLLAKRVDVACPHRESRHTWRAALPLQVEALCSSRLAGMGRRLCRRIGAEEVRIAFSSLAKQCPRPVSRRLVLAYHKLYDQLHRKAPATASGRQAAKLVYIRNENEALLGWVRFVLSYIATARRAARNRPVKRSSSTSPCHHYCQRAPSLLQLIRSFDGRDNTRVDSFSPTLRLSECSRRMKRAIVKLQDNGVQSTSSSMYKCSSPA